MKRSLTLAVKKMSDPTNLGARPKNTYMYKNQTKQIPNASKPEEVKQEDDEEIENDQIVEVQDAV